MKNGYVYIGNRQSGKSNLAIHEYMKDFENSLLLVNKDDMVKHIKKMIEENYDHLDGLDFKRNIVSPEKMPYRGATYSKIIFDEFFFIHERKAIDVWEILTPMLKKDGEIYIFSTYDQENIERQMLFTSVLAENGWKVINLRKGKKEPSARLIPWMNIDNPFRYWSHRDIMDSL